MKDVRNKNEDFRIAESKMQYNQHISLDPFQLFLLIYILPKSKKLGLNSKKF